MRIDNIFAQNGKEPDRQSDKKPYLRPTPNDSVEFTKKVLKTNFLYAAGSAIIKAFKPNSQQASQTPEISPEKETKQNNPDIISENMQPLKIIKRKGIKTLDKPENATKAALDTEGILSYEPLLKCLKNTNLEQYRYGIPLIYPRNKFIQDFKSEIKNLDKKEQEMIFKHFGFEIDDRSDIINCPIPNGQIPDNLSKEGKRAIQECNNCIINFLFSNSVRTPENKDFEQTMNTIIKAFPEFTTIIGKKDHKGESLDYHTLKVLQIAIKNPETKDLTKEEQRMLVLSVLFHDFAKKEGVVHHEHPQESAKYAKEVFNKLNLPDTEKERMHTLIKHSHWLGDLNTGKNTQEEIAAIFRNPNDFKMAKILGDADINSSALTIGLFGKALKAAPYGEIEAKIKRIHENSPLVFNTKFPTNKTVFPKDNKGVMVLDFSNPDADLKTYGFKNGITPSKLKSFVHYPAINQEPDEILSLCSEKEDVILNSKFASPSVHSKNSSPYAILFDCPNANVISLKTSLTSAKNGLSYVVNLFFKHNMENDSTETAFSKREEIPNAVKNMLSISNDEYSELFKKTANCPSLEEIPQEIKVSETKTIAKKDFQNAINTLYSKFNGEFTLFKPTPQAFVVKKEQYIHPENYDIKTKNTIEKLKLSAKEYEIPVVLV